MPWERLDIPALVLSGLQDRVFFEAADVAALSAKLPHAERMSLPDVGHLVSMERPQAVVDACLALGRRIA